MASNKKNGKKVTAKRPAGPNPAAVPVNKPGTAWKYAALAGLLALAIAAAGILVRAPAGPGASAVASVSGDAQKLSVQVLSGSYEPSSIQLKAGLPAEITFSESTGCTGQVQSSQLGFSEDLSSGPKTVKLPALAPGTYGFACGMGMVSGRIVVS